MSVKMPYEKDKRAENARKMWAEMSEEDKKARIEKMKQAKINMKCKHKVKLPPIQ